MIRLSSSITFYKTLLGIQTVTAISETTIQLEYDNIAGTSNPVTLLLEYDPTSRRLIDARVSFNAEYNHTGADDSCLVPIWIFRSPRI
jgi:hypothetical protein